MVGSKFKDDSEKEDYAYQTLSEIVLCADRGIPLILDQMDYIYSSLYDLLNQRFIQVGTQRYCRIALGAHYNPRCYIHRDFRVVVFLDKSAIKNTDAPLLNRFEKQYFSIKALMKTGELTIYHQFMEQFERLGLAKTKKESAAASKFKMSPSEIFLNYSKELVKLWIYDDKEGLKSEGVAAVMDYLWKKLITCATPDFLFWLHQSNFSHSEQQYFEKLYDETHTHLRKNCERTDEELVGIDRGSGGVYVRQRS